jgi:hypothetical protein
LNVLLCGGNQLTSLDISNNGTLASQHNFYYNLDIGNMPSLGKVCVWTMPFPPGSIDLFMEGSPNVYFTLDCSK